MKVGGKGKEFVEYGRSTFVSYVKGRSAHSRISTKNPDKSTGPFARPFDRSLPHSRYSECLDGYLFCVFFSVLDHSGLGSL